MNKRTKRIFKDNELRAKRPNWKPLIYACGGFAIFLLFWVVVMNSGSDDLTSSTREGIAKGRQSVEDLKESIYTQEVEEVEQHDDTEGSPLSGLSDNSLAELAPGVVALIVILGVFGAVAAIVYAVVGIMRGGGMV